MKRMQLVLDADLVDKFRARAGQKKGARKGALGEAFSEALNDWIKKK